MYDIKLDLDTLYNPLLTDDGRAIIEGSIDLEIDTAGTATITVPKTNPLYDSLGRMRKTIYINNDGVEVFSGRILSDDKDFFGNKRLTVEGLQAYFLDCIMPPHNMETTVRDFFTYVIGVYNSQVDPYRRLTVGDITVTDADVTKTFQNVEYVSTQDAIFNEIISNSGGHLRIRRTANGPTVDLLGEFTHICSQPIQFGRNLLDFDESADCADIVTVCIPLGTMQTDAQGTPIGRVNITSVTEGGVEYVTDAAAGALYGNIWRAIIWEDVADPAQLKTLGEQYLAEHKAASTTITISAVDLHSINVNAEAISLGDKVRVISEPHGLDDYFQCNKIHIDLLDPARSEYTFGAVLKTISEMQAQTLDSMEDGSAEQTLKYLELSSRITSLAASQPIKHPADDQTTVAAIYAAAPALSVSHVFLGATITDRPVAYGGTLVIYKLTAEYGMLTYYANDGEIYAALMNNGTLAAWKKITQAALGS